MAIVTDGEWDELVRDLARRVAVYAPDWTDRQDSDPGITILELIAFLGESLRERPTRTHKVTAVPYRALPALTRPRYFAGQLLSVGDLELEQDYLRTKHRRHNLLLHGIGIVRGLDVAVGSGRAGDEPHVTVTPGLAIAPDGEELLVVEPVTIALASDPSSGFVTLGLVDRPLDPMPTPTGAEASHVVEDVEVGLLAEIPASHLAIARVEQADHGWRVDPAFEAPRPRP